MAAKLWEGCFSTYFDTSLRPASGAQAWFYTSETSSPITTYSDPALSIPRTSPVVASGSGRFPAIYLPFVDYRVRVADANGVSILDIDGIENVDPATGSGGGGSGGGDVTQEQAFQTGDPLFLEKNGSRTGWVRDNGRTIGNALSGASERANADTAALYAFYYDTYSAAICPVTGGRGANAASDYAAGKPIATLDKRGKVPVGLDTMGNSASNRIQASTTITTTNGQTSAVVASAANLTRGMYVVSANITAGTTISAISGFTVTLSIAATGTASGTAARFSMFTDAETPGASGGVQSVSLLEAENGPHVHTGTTNADGNHTHSGTTSTENTSHDHAYQVAGGLTSFDRNLTGATGSALTTAAASTLATGTQSQVHIHTFSISPSGAHQHAFTTASSGGGQPHTNLQPGILGTWYRKLVWLGGLPVVADIALRALSGSV